MAIYVCGAAGCAARGKEVEAPTPSEFRRALQRCVCGCCKGLMTYRRASINPPERRNGP